MKHYPKQQGYILLPVVLIITLVAIVALMMNVESGMETGTSRAEREADEVRYVAEAALNHAQWSIDQAGCGRYTDLSGQAFGDHSYSTRITPNPSGGTITTVMVAVSDDAFIKEDTPTQNYGNDAQLQVLNQNLTLQRALYRFDIANAGIPVGATVLSATLKLFVVDPDNTNAVNIHRVETDWIEATVTWNSMHDQYALAVQGAIPQGPAAGEYAVLNITALVQGWVNGSLANQGIMLVPVGWNDVSQYSSKEYGNVNQRPVLEVKTTDGSVSTSADISVTGTLANGVSRTVTREDVVLYQPAVSLSWQPGSELEDAFIDGTRNDRNFGISPILNLKDDGNVLIRFPIEALPPGARVLDAKLDLYLAAGGGFIDGLLDLHRISRSWVEGIHDNTTSAPGEGVTYDDYDGGDNWATPGGDHDSAIIDRVMLPGAVPGWYTWNVTGQMQAWLGGQANFGFLLRKGGGTAGSINFVSSDDTVTPEYHPWLTLRIACECGQACLVPQGSGNVLVVVSDPGDLTTGEDVLLRLFETWGYAYSLIQDDDSQGNFDAAMLTHDVVFISESVDAGDVGTKLTNTGIGVVSAKNDLNDELGIATDRATRVGQDIEITDTSHAITQIFSAGLTQFKTAATELNTVSGTLAPGAQVLAEMGGVGTLVVLETGAELAGGGNAAGRRVMVPLGEADVDPYLTNNGQLIIQRAIEWAKPLSCNDGDYGDNFDVVAYNNNDGSLTWGSDWTEVDGDGAGPAAGNVGIFGGRLVLDDRPNTGGQPSATRLMNLQGATRAFLDYDFELGSGIDTGSDVAILEITTDGSNWTELKDFSTFGGGDSGHHLIDLAGHLSADTQIRFRIQAFYGGNNENLQIDNLTVSICGTLDDPASAGPIAHWKLDETGGPTAMDSEGGHDGTLTNGPVWTPGQVDGGLQFDGSDDFIDVPHDDALSLTETMTLMAWANAAAYGASYQTILCKDLVGDSNFWFGTWQRELVFGFFAGGAFREVYTTGLNLLPSTWYHLAASFDNATDTVRLYVDGLEVHSGSLAFDPTPVTANVWIGKSPDGEFWPGLLDDVRIYDRVLGGTDIADIVDAGSPPPGDVEYLDQFNASAFDNSDGSLDWSPWLWTEISDDGAPDTGNVRVRSGFLVLNNLDGGAFEGATRGADLSIGSPATAVLSFDYGGRGEVSSGDSVRIGVSDNGGGSWVILDNISVAGDVSGSRSYNLHDSIALTNNSRIGLIISAGLDGPGQYFYLDDVAIDLGTAAGGGCNGSYEDAFNTRTFSGSDGSLNWAGDWQEVGESDGPTAGDIRVRNNISNYQLRLRDNNNGGEGVEREADLSGAGSATLTFNYRRQGLDNANDYVKVEISANGAAGPWTEIARFQGNATDATYQPSTLDIGSYASANTRIRFVTSPTMGNFDTVWFDDITITCSP